MLNRPSKPISIKNGGLGGLVDRLYAVRQDYLAAKAVSDQAQAKFKEVEQQVIVTLKQIGTEKGAGKKAQVSLSQTETGVIEDFDALWKWAIKNDAGDMFHKRLTQEAWRGRREAGVAVPGVGEVLIDKLSLTARK